ncbi:CHAT domain-containing protein [Parapedobacter pyrenivorans]|uniref:CHAT domain-containing protein n=1 Tax=Parapedobacter pyrenivorans TaxID=1305674 RepID=UPI00333FD098
MKRQIYRVCGVLLCLLQTSSLLAQTSDYARSLAAYRNQEYDSAFWFLDRAVKVFGQANQQDSLVWAYVHKAEVTWSALGNWPAIRVADSALVLASQLPKHHLARVAALNKKGQILVHVSHITEGEACLLEAEECIPLGDTLSGIVATLYNNISWMYMVKKQLTYAFRYAERCLYIQKELYGDDARQLLGVYQSLGLIASDAGRFEDAERYSLELYRLARLHLPATHPNMALVHNQLAIIYEQACRYTDALYHLEGMVHVAQQEFAETRNPQFLAISYNNTGNLYNQLGEYSLAEAYFGKALRLHQINYGDEEAGIVEPLAHLADAKRKLGKFEEADSLFKKAYRIQEEYGAGNVIEAADLESQVGDLSYDLGDFGAAETWYRRALAQYQKAGVVGTTMVAETKTTLGRTLASLGQIAESLQLFEEVLGEYRNRYPKGNLFIAGKLNNISETYVMAGRLEKAMQYSDSTFMELLMVRTLPDENWVTDLPFTHHVVRYLNNRATILEQRYGQTKKEAILQEIVRLARAYGEYFKTGAAALRTQSALIELAERQKKLYQTALNAAWLLAEEHGRTEYLATAFEFAEMGKAMLLRLAANNLMVDGQAVGRKDGFSLDRQWRSQISALNTQYLNTGGENDSLLTELTKVIEGYRGFQDSVLATGDSRWVSRFDTKPYHIDDVRKRLLKEDRTLVEYAVTEKDVYAFVINADEFKVFRTPRSQIAEKVDVLRRLQKLGVSEFVDAAYPLYQLLVAPLEKLITGKRLLIVPDAELFGINFEILLTTMRGSAFSELDYLVRSYEITYLLSASSAIQQLQHPWTSSNEGLFMVPTFTERMKKLQDTHVRDSLANDLLHTRLLRQPFSLKAAQDALRFIKGNLYVEEAADEQRFRAEAGHYRVLHMGTHAEVNNISPLHSRLFLAKATGIDSVEDDGILHAYEVYSMQLRAELAVLSACNTGVGKFHDGEGVISLAHSFLYAGCSSVLMSLWDIDEKTNATITAGFYANLSRGMRKSEALRRAKLAYLADVPQELTHPYYWAGLGLIGNNDPIYPNRYWNYWLVALASAAALLAGWLFFARKRQRNNR